MFLPALLFIVCFACFTQSVSGFGLAIVATPLFHLMGVPTILSVPLIAMIGLLMRPIMLFHYWGDFHWRDIWRLSLSAVIGVPLGVILFENADAHLINTILGVIIVGYAIYTGYGYYRQQTPRLVHENWAWVSGFISGLLGGAFNIFGPPTIIYANQRLWEKRRFKANLQAFALFMSVAISGTHLISGNVTPEVLFLLMLMLPTAMVGMLVGFWLDKRIPHHTFNYIVLVLLVVTGISLVL